MALTKRRGYTLIEMMVVTVVLVLFSAIITPEYVNIRDSQKRRAFYASVVDLAGNARELAIVHHATMYLQADTSQNMIVVKQENNDSTYLAADGSSGSTASANATANSTVQDNNPQSNIATTDADHSRDITKLTLPMAPTVQFGNFQITGQPSDASSWKIRFFSDGTSDSGGVELTDKGATRSLVINTKGGAKLIDGSIPDSSQDRWIAGNYVQRQQ